jgi:hypothetical protein
MNKLMTELIKRKKVERIIQIRKFQFDIIIIIIFANNKPTPSKNLLLLYKTSRTSQTHSQALITSHKKQYSSIKFTNSKLNEHKSLNLPFYPQKISNTINSHSFGNNNNSVALRPTL